VTKIVSDFSQSLLVNTLFLSYISRISQCTIQSNGAIWTKHDVLSWFSRDSSRVLSEYKSRALSGDESVRRMCVQDVNCCVSVQCLMMRSCGDCDESVCIVKAAEITYEFFSY